MTANEPGVESEHQPNGLWTRLRASLPGWKTAIFGSLLWGLGMALSAWFALWQEGLIHDLKLVFLLLLYFLGGLFSFPFALFLMAFTGAGRRFDTRFAASFLSLATCTVLMTAFLFSLQYRQFYAQWHAPFGTEIWMFQYVFTAASAVYQFMVSGLRLYLPAGMVMILATAAFLARRMR
jgi:hypothetical protein